MNHSNYVWKIAHDGDYHYVIARDAEDALKVISETDGHEDAEGLSEPLIVLGNLAVWDDDGSAKTTKPAAEWAKEGRGYLAGTMYP